MCQKLLYWGTHHLPPTSPIHPSVRPPSHPPTHPFFHPPIQPSAYPSTFSPTYSPTYSSIHPSHLLCFARYRQHFHYDSLLPQVLTTTRVDSISLRQLTPLLRLHWRHRFNYLDDVIIPSLPLSGRPHAGVNWTSLPKTQNVVTTTNL